MKGRHFLLYLCDIIDCLAMTDQEELHENEEKKSACVPLCLCMLGCEWRVYEVFVGDCNVPQ